MYVSVVFIWWFVTQEWDMKHIYSDTVLRIDKPFPLNILLDSFHPYQGGRSLRYFQQLLSWHFFLSLVPMSILLELTSLYSELVAEWPFCFIMGWKNDIVKEGRPYCNWFIVRILTAVCGWKKAGISWLILIILCLKLKLKCLKSE